MGATRRLDHYSASLGWQQLFIVSGIGAVMIGAGVGVQLLQFGYSIYKRKANLDKTGDPWDGRSLEWSTPSPVPFYNFARLPEVVSRDAYWEAKKHQLNDKRAYEDIEIPKNTPLGFLIALAAFVVAFAIVWHIWWLATLGIVGVISIIIIRSMDEQPDYVLPAKEVEKLDKMYAKGA